MIKSKLGWWSLNRIRHWYGGTRPHIYDFKKAQDDPQILHDYVDANVIAALSVSFDHVEYEYRDEGKQ